MALLMRLPGQPAAILEKRAADARHYELDCKLLLREFELLASILSVQGADVDEDLSKVAPNNILKLYVKASSPKSELSFTDSPISAVCKTSQGTVQISALLRVHSQ